MKKEIASIIITVGLVIGIGIIFIGNSKPKDADTLTESIENTEVKDGVQYVTINAKGGYFPRISQAQAGIPTKIIMKTSGTYDCSSALVIRSIGYQKVLPQTGKTEIDIGIPKAGVPLQGLCSMGMYSFVVNFS